MKKISVIFCSGLLFFILTNYSLLSAAALSIDNPDFISPITDSANQNQTVQANDLDQSGLRLQIIEAGNLLEVSVRQDSKINKTVRVDNNGYIQLHLLGSVKAAGLMLQELEKEIVQKLERDYINKPKVTIKLLEYKALSITITGAVGRAGQYKLFSGMTVLDAISMAGNFVAQSDPSNINIIRINKQNGISSINIKTNVEQILSGRIQDVPLEAGDQIIIGELTSIYVEGAVMLPGPVYTKSQISLRDALIGAGGVSDRADMNRIKVFESREKKSAEAKIYDLESNAVEGRAKEPMIAPGSLIMVEECVSKSKFFGKVICNHK